MMLRRPARLVAARPTAALESPAAPPFSQDG